MTTETQKQLGSVYDQKSIDYDLLMRLNSELEIGSPQLTCIIYLADNKSLKKYPRFQALARSKGLSTNELIARFDKSSTS